MVVVMVNMPGSEDDVEGCDVAAIWMSVRAAIVLATTFATFQERPIIHEYCKLTIGLLSDIIS